jgi:hypothetical protein
MVYHKLWKSKRRVAACHKATASDILACYDDMVLAEPELMNDTTEIAHPDLHWRTNSRTGLLQWLLANRSLLGAGMALFNFRVFWNIWPIVPYNDFGF